VAEIVIMALQSRKKSNTYDLQTNNLLMGMIKHGHIKEEKS